MNKKIQFTSSDNFPCSGMELNVISINQRDRSESIMNVVILTSKVLKDHVLRDESFAFKYMDNVICRTMEYLIAEASSPDKRAVPMELMDVYNLAEMELQPWRRRRNAYNKNLCRSYVKVWSKLYGYMVEQIKFVEVEKIFICAYNELFGKNFEQTLKQLNSKELLSD